MALQAVDHRGGRRAVFPLESPRGYARGPRCGWMGAYDGLAPRPSSGREACISTSHVRRCRRGVASRSAVHACLRRCARADRNSRLAMHVGWCQRCARWESTAVGDARDARQHAAWARHGRNYRALGSGPVCVERRESVRRHVLASRRYSPTTVCIMRRAHAVAEAIVP
jgi:hypothetical protein